MGKKTKNPKGIHRFELKPISKHCYFKKKISVDFCFKKNSQNCECAEEQNNSNYVVFNKDRNYATPSFILNFDQQYYFNFRWNLKTQYDQKIKQMESYQAAIEFPNPKSEKRKCRVCDCIYTDYIQHIYSKTHKKKIQQSTFNQAIIELTKTFSSSKMENSTQYTNKNNNTISEQSNQNSLQLPQNSIRTSQQALVQEQDQQKIREQTKSQVKIDCFGNNLNQQINVYNSNKLSQQKNQVYNTPEIIYWYWPLFQQAKIYLKNEKNLLQCAFLLNFEKYKLLEYLNQEYVKFETNWQMLYRQKQTIQQQIGKYCHKNNNIYKLIGKKYAQASQNKEIDTIIRQNQLNT